MVTKTADLNFLALTIARDPELAAMLPEGEGCAKERAIALYEEAFVRSGVARASPLLGYRLRSAFEADHDRVDYWPDALADLNLDCLQLGLESPNRGMEPGSVTALMGIDWSAPGIEEAIAAVRLMCLALSACERRERRAVPRPILERVTVLPDQDIVPIDWSEARLAQRPLPRPLPESLLKKIAAAGRKMAGLR